MPDRSQAPLARQRSVTYFGFDLEKESEPLRAWPGADGDEARLALAEALARGEALHPAVRRHRPVIDEIREVWRRSGGTTPRLALAELVALYERALAGVEDVHQWKAARLAVEFEDIVSGDVRAQWLALPGAVEIRDRPVPIEYDVEFDPAGVPSGVARLRLPEKVARTLVDEELPELDRPLRFVVHRGARGAVRGRTLTELQNALDEPFTDTEKQERHGKHERHGRHEKHGKGRPGSDPRKKSRSAPWKGRGRRGR